MKQRSIELLNNRAKAAGMLNATGVVGTIAEYGESFHVALGLHACGSATDHAMEKVGSGLVKGFRSNVLTFASKDTSRARVSCDGFDWF
jgi:predicted GNAT superfamily acetyltransferase